MEEKKKASEERQLMKMDEVSLEEIQLAEQLYNSVGLDPVVDAGLKDYDGRLQQGNKLINKVLGPRASDIKGYGKAVAKRVASAIYTQLNRQYGGKVGDLRSYIMALQEERDRANTKYEELMGRVVGMLGDEYKELRIDSKAFVERLTTTLGEDLKESRIDHGALAERLADIDGLRAQIKTLNEEKEQLKQSYESQITASQSEHSEEIKSLKSQITDLNTKTKSLESKNTILTSDLTQLREDHNQLKTAVTKLATAVPYKEIGGKLGHELHAFILKDSKVPNTVIEGVGSFLNFSKYLEMAAVRGAEEATKEAEEMLRSVFSE